MGEADWQAERFEQHRARMQAVAYRMLGSVADADDAVQDAWLRFSRADTADVENLGGWLTTVVARVCLNRLRARRSRREDSLEIHLPDPIISAPDAPNPEQEAVLADSVSLAMLVVLDTLAPAERVAFVLHDVFALPFDQIAPIVGRTEPAARQLASRARRRIRGSAPTPDADRRQQWAVVNAFLAASRDGDFEALMAVLDPEIVLRADRGDRAPEASTELQGAAAVAGAAMSFRSLARYARTALVNGMPGVVIMREDGPYAVIAVTVAGGRIAEIDILADRDRLRSLDLSAVGEN